MPSHATTDPHEHAKPIRQPTGSPPKGRSAQKAKPSISNPGSSSKSKENRRGSKSQETKPGGQNYTVEQIKELKETNDDEIMSPNGVDGKQKESNEEITKGDSSEKVTDDNEESAANDAVPVANRRTRFTRPETEVKFSKPETPPPSPKPEVFTLEKFNDVVDNFSDVFSSHKYTNITDEYPVEDLVTLVNDVTGKIEEYKQQTITSQRHLEDLRGRMHEVKRRIQENVQKKSNAIRMDDDSHVSIEEKELREKLARLNAQVAQANAELAEALRLSAETESSAVEAQLAAERAKQEARNIQEEIEFRTKVEERRKETDKKRQEEERLKMEQRRLQEEEEQRRKEEEWRRREHGSDKPPVWEAWPMFEYMVENGAELGCVVRGQPNKFNKNDVTVTSQDQLEHPVPFGENEELVSYILLLQGHDDKAILKDPIALYIPVHAGKQSFHGHTAREYIVKAEKGGKWVCLETREETLENYKDVKFAVAEVNSLERVAVFSRLKRDYSTISKKGGKVTSSFDQRICMTIPKGCITGKDHIMMEVLPLDSSSVTDLKSRSTKCKGLLSSSPIVHMQFESTAFETPVTVTVPCPPNPIKAKKLAAMRKAKEEKMKNPTRAPILLPHEIEALEKEKQKSKLQKMQEQIAAAENQKDEPKPTKWYMGDYAMNEDDENDNLYLISCHGNKWTPVENVNIMQVKLDLLQFDLDRPLEKFMVLRTKTNVKEEEVGSMANEVSSFLSQKFVQVILKQKSNDPLDTVLSVVPTSRTEKTLKKLSQEGYDDGPEPSQALSINEGDVIEVGFRGNIKSRDSEDIQFVYNSNMDSETEFHACEVDKYLQRNFPVYRGVVEVYRNYKVKTATTRRKRRDSNEENEEQPYENKRDKLCELAINIPKYYVEQNSAVIRAPVTIHNTSDPVNDELCRFVAEELGEEWKMVAGYLNVSKPRVQAILRNLQNGDCNDCDARYDMLMTWLKKTPKAVDKVSCLSNALLKSGRGDLAEEIRSRDREFRENHVTN